MFPFPPEPIAIAIREPELGHLGGNVQKGISPRKEGILMEPSMRGKGRVTRILQKGGMEEFLGKEDPKSREPKEGMSTQLA